MWSHLLAVTVANCPANCSNIRDVEHSTRTRSVSKFEYSCVYRTPGVYVKQSFISFWPLTHPRWWCDSCCECCHKSKTRWRLVYWQEPSSSWCWDRSGRHELEWWRSAAPWNTKTEKKISRLWACPKPCALFTPLWTCPKPHALCPHAQQHHH